MYSSTFVGLLGVWGVLAGVSALADEAKNPHCLMIGYIHDHNIITVDKGVKKKKDADPQLIFKAKLEAEYRSPLVYVRYDFDDAIVHTAPYRWRIEYDCFWGTGATMDRGKGLRRASLDELPLMEPRTKEQKDSFRKKYPENTYDSLTMFEWGLQPLGEVWLRNGGRLGCLIPPPLDPPLYFDFLPIGKTAILLFIVGRGKMRVWEETATYSKEKVEWDEKWKEKKEFEMKADFAEPFFVYEAGSAYYFVTVSGKLYRSKLPKDLTKPKKDEAKVVPLWTDAKRPIRAVITDTSSKKTFVFTEPARADVKEDGHRYFELAEKIEPKQYETKPVADAKAPRALRQVLPYADFLLKEKKIK
jgi:hypothetical protein